MDELATDPEREFSFELQSQDAAAPVLTLAGELDMATIDRLDETMQPVLSAHPQRLVVDVSAVSFADSSAIAKLVVWSKAAGDMELRGASPLLRRVISAMGLERALHLT